MTDEFSRKMLSSKVSERRFNARCLVSCQLCCVVWPYVLEQVRLLDTIRRSRFRWVQDVLYAWRPGQQSMKARVALLVFPGKAAFYGNDGC